MTSLKLREKTADTDSKSHNLLLALVKLIHADPKLMLHVSIAPRTQVLGGPDIF